MGILPRHLEMLKISNVWDLTYECRGSYLGISESHRNVDLSPRNVEGVKCLGSYLQMLGVFPWSEGIFHLGMLGMSSRNEEVSTRMLGISNGGDFTLEC